MDRHPSAGTDFHLCSGVLENHAGTVTSVRWPVRIQHISLHRILLWTLFSEIALKAQVVFIEQANLLKKVNFPRLCLPLVVVGSGLVRFVIVQQYLPAFSP